MVGKVKAVVLDSGFSSLSSVIDYYLAEKAPWMPSIIIQYIISSIHWTTLFDIERAVRPVDRVQHLRIPVLLTHGTVDQVVPFSNALEIKKAIESNPNIPEYEEYFFPGRHVQTYNSPGYFLKMIDFFERHV